MAGFNTAVTGIKATTTALDVTGNNIANASTVGFKSTRAEFADIYSTQVVGAGSSNIAGAGVLVSDLAQDFSSGTIEFTNSNLDLAVNGSGFFQLNDGQGGITYTRGGAFELDKEGFIVSKNGKNLRGYGLDAQGNQLPLTNLQVQEKESPPHATENIGLSINLQPEAELEKKADYYTKTNAGSYSYTTTVETFDSLGNTQAVKFNYVEQKAQREYYEFTVAPAGVSTQGDPTVTPLDTTTAGIMSVSGVPVAWEETGAPGVAALPSAGGAGDVFVPNAGTVAKIKELDPRIDTDTISYDFDTGVLSYKLKSEATGQGDVVVTLGDGTAVEQTPTNLTAQGQPILVAANEVLRFALTAADTSGAGALATAFDAGADAVDDDALQVATTISIGGVDITLPAGIGRDAAGETIVDQYESSIKENDPTIESVSYDSLTNEVVITWKPESGDVYPLGTTPFEVLGSTTAYVDDPTTVATSLFAMSSATPGSFDSVARTAVEGDNSYLGTYRVYAYLNDDQLLNIGKAIDPGESGGSADFVDLSKYTEPGPVVIKFSPTTGLIESVNGADVKDQDNVPKLVVRGSDQANPNDNLSSDDIDSLRGVQLNISGSTRWESASIVKDQSQDGYSKGDLIGVSFDEQGKMVAAYSNGQKKEIGIVALATFESQSGLQPAGDSEWVPTLDSGQARLNPPGTGLNGSLRSGALEQSNVDLSSELVKLIEFQRNYQANSKTLETLNTVTQSILQI